jgi:hypothetical protein
MTPRRRRLVALLCLVALVGAALAGPDSGGVWALVPLPPALPAALVVVLRLPPAEPSPASILFARDEGSRAPPLA